MSRLCVYSVNNTPPHIHAKYSKCNQTQEVCVMTIQLLAHCCAWIRCKVHILSAKHDKLDTTSWHEYEYEVRSPKSEVRSPKSEVQHSVVTGLLRVRGL